MHNAGVHTDRSDVGPLVGKVLDDFETSSFGGEVSACTGIGVSVGWEAQDASRNTDYGGFRRAGGICRWEEGVGGE